MSFSALLLLAPAALAGAASSPAALRSADPVAAAVSAPLRLPPLLAGSFSEPGNPIARLLELHAEPLTRGGPGAAPLLRRVEHKALYLAHPEARPDERLAGAALARLAAEPERAGLLLERHPALALSPIALVPAAAGAGSPYRDSRRPGSVLERLAAWARGEPAVRALFGEERPGLELEDAVLDWTGLTAGSRPAETPLRRLEDGVDYRHPRVRGAVVEVADEGGPAGPLPPWARREESLARAMGEALLGPRLLGADAVFRRRGGRPEMRPVLVKEALRGSSLASAAGSRWEPRYRDRVEDLLGRVADAGFDPRSVRARDIVLANTPSDPVERAYLVERRLRPLRGAGPAAALAEALRDLRSWASRKGLAW